MPVTNGGKTAFLPPIDSIFSEAHLYNLFKNKEAKKLAEAHKIEIKFFNIIP